MTSKRRGRAGWVLGVALTIALLWQCFRIFPYTFLAPVQMHAARSDDAGNLLRLLIFNVRYDNRPSDELLELVRETDPDVILLVEPTGWWKDRLSPLEQSHPHTILQPQENHYGVLLYSRLELSEPQVLFRVDPEVPSVRAAVRLPSGERIVLHGLHPKPPGLKRNQAEEREDSDQRDAELLTVAREVAENPRMAVIVAGDFNDVAWSHTTRLFQRLSGLLDPRVGRGLYNTYKAGSPIARFPLDHVFASEHFRLVGMRVLPPTGSDHHPVLVVLSLEPDVPGEQTEPTPNPGDHAEAEEAIEDGRSPDDD